MINVLLIEDNLADVRLTQEMLNESRDDSFSFQYSASLREGAARIKSENFDLILLDLGLPDSTGVDSVKEVTSINPKIPIIVFTVLGTENLGIKAIDYGAQDYLIKDETTAPLLIKSIKYSISRKKFEEHLLHKENMFRLATENALKEKEILLKELNHRVKNNLQMIHSLISLQMNAAGENGTDDFYNDIKNRIKSLGLVHDKLSKSPSFSSINFEDYCRDLLSNIEDTLPEKRHKITVSLDIEDVNINYEIISSIGLIMNEIVTNSYKYAFPGGQTGRIYVNLKRLDNNVVELKFGDTGVGLPNDIDFENSGTLGLQLISMLSQQIEADLKFNRYPGTEYTLTFNPGTK